jgi:flagellar motor switch protein FliN/FliY
MEKGEGEGERGPESEVPLDRREADRLIAMLDPEVLGNVGVELAATLGRGSLTMHRLASLETGEVVALDTPLNGVVELSLNGKLVARGEIVAVGDKFGVRISEILTRKQ